MKQLINLGTGPNSGLGDTLYSGSVKINENFDELYQTIGNAVTLDHIHSGNGISVVLTPGVATIVNTKPNVQSDWNIDDPEDLRSILNKPVLSSLAFSGSYNDLIDVPVMPTFADVALSGEYGDLLNAPDLAPVAFSGDYGDLINTPTTTYSDRLVSGLFNVTLDGNVGTLSVPDGIRFSLPLMDHNIYGPSGDHTLIISSGANTLTDPHGGNMRLIAGTSDNMASGVGGNVRIESGTGATLGGNILLQAGAGGGGTSWPVQDIHSTGGSINLKAGYGTGRGGSIVLSTDTNSMYDSTNDEPGVLNGDVVIEINRPAGYVWTYSGNTVRNRNTVSQTTSATCPVGPPTEIFASWAYQPSPGLIAVSPGIKLLISAEGEVTGDSSGTHTEFVEVMIARRTGSNTLAVQTFNRVYTSSGPLMNITASVDSTTGLTRVYCQPTDSTKPVSVITSGIEHYEYVLSGNVIV